MERSKPFFDGEVDLFADFPEPEDKVEVDPATDFRPEDFGFKEEPAEEIDFDAEPDNYFEVSFTAPEGQEIVAATADNETAGQLSHVETPMDLLNALISELGLEDQVELVDKDGSEEEVCAECGQPVSECACNECGDKKLTESQSQNLSNLYRLLKDRFRYTGKTLDELVHGPDGFMATKYPDGFPDFNGDLLYSEKYWREFEKWLEAKYGDDDLGVKIVESKIDDFDTQIQSDEIAAVSGLEDIFELEPTDEAQPDFTPEATSQLTEVIKPQFIIGYLVYDYGWYITAVDRDSNGNLITILHGVKGNKFTTPYDGTEIFDSVDACIEEIKQHQKKYLEYVLPQYIDFVSGRRNGTLVAIELNDSKDGYKKIYSLFDCKAGKLVKSRILFDSLNTSELLKDCEKKSDLKTEHESENLTLNEDKTEEDDTMTPEEREELLALFGIAPTDESLNEAKLSNASLRKAIRDRYAAAVKGHYQELLDQEDKKTANEWKADWYKIKSIDVTDDDYVIAFNKPIADEESETLLNFIVDDSFKSIHPGEDKVDYAWYDDNILGVSREALNESLNNSKVLKDAEKQSNLKTKNESENLTLNEVHGAVDKDWYEADIRDAIKLLARKGKAEFWCLGNRPEKAEEVVKRFKEKFGKDVTYEIEDELCTARVVNGSLKEGTGSSRTNTFVDAVYALARKAAKDWNKLTDAEREEYEDQGTASFFENYGDEYMAILNADENFSKREMKAAGLDTSDPDSISDEAFDFLDGEFWEAVEALEEDYTGTPEIRTTHLEYEDKDVTDGKAVLPDNITKKEDDHCKKVNKVINHTPDEQATLKESVSDEALKKMVEDLEENEEEVECKWCDELYPKSDCRKEVKLGWLCPYCRQAIRAHGEPLTFIDDDFDESLEETTDQDLKDNRQPIPEVSKELGTPVDATEMRKHEAGIQEGVKDKEAVERVKRELEAALADF